jgi:undecaprenyl pyrophosphate phosphatase UppP
MASKSDTREGRIRDRWLALAVAFLLAAFLAHGIHASISDAWLEVVAVMAFAAMVGSTVMVVVWGRRADPDSEFAQRTLWKLRWTILAAACFATGAILGRTVPGYIFWNAAWVVLLLDWLHERRAEKSN